MNTRSLALPLLFWVLALLFAGCGGATAQPTKRLPAPSSTPISARMTPTPKPMPTAKSVEAGAQNARPTPTLQSVQLVEERQIALYCGDDLPLGWREALEVALNALPGTCVRDPSQATVHLTWQPLARVQGEALVTRYYAVVAPFATIRDDISLPALQAFWLGEGGPLVVAEEAVGPLSAIFNGTPAHTAPASEMLAQLQENPGAFGILPFDQLDPAFKVLTVDYPLAVGLTIAGEDVERVLPLLRAILQPSTNRDVDRMTTLIMTGVTAMSRGTAAKMEQKGILYPTLIISNTLSAADITHVSNEVPFIEGCQVNNTYMNLTLCSDYPYIQALQAIGVDIVGLSGNHVNDFGREGARESLAFYQKHNIAVYGSGLNEEDACKPLLWEDHGNTYAFLAALAWWPEDAWATETEPGACSYYANYDRIFETVQQLSQQVDIVSVELQFEETYNPWPTEEQIREFRALHEAGADIVTGVQSHVPQAVEPYGAHEPGGPAIILYGLGNLFFDQMQSWETRTGLIARHTIYQGRLLSTELLTTVLEDYAQPRWATPQERAEILQTIFEAAPPKVSLSAASTKSTLTTPTPEAPVPTQTASIVQPTATSMPPTPIPASTSLPTLTPTPVSTNQVVRAPSQAVVTLPQPTPPPAGAPLLPWPQHQGVDQPHFFLSRPTSWEFNQLEDHGYAFGSTANGRYRVHHGVDIANPAGTPLLAPADGVVFYAGRDDEAHQFGPYPNFYGNVLVLQLDQTWQGRTVYVLYGHMQSVGVQAGQYVRRGEEVARTGMEGIAIGPHVHVEVRLDDPRNYDNVYNPALWMEPFAGYGVLAGQVITEDGRAWHEIKLHVYRLTNEGAQLYRVFSTYAMDRGLQPDPVLAENAVLGSVPAGQYQVVLKLHGVTYQQRVYVGPGQVGWFNFMVGP